MNTNHIIKIKISDDNVIVLDGNTSLVNEFKKIPDKYMISNPDICKLEKDEFVIVNTDPDVDDIIFDYFKLEGKYGRYINVRNDSIHVMTLDNGILDPGVLTRLAVISKEFFMKHSMNFILSELWNMSLALARKQNLNYIKFRIVFDNGYGKGNYVDLEIPRETKISTILMKYFPTIINEGISFFNLPGVKKMKMKKITTMIDDTPSRYTIPSTMVPDNITQHTLNKLISTYIDISNKEVFIKVNKDILNKLISETETTVEDMCDDSNNEITEDTIINIDKDYLFKPKDKEIVNVRKVIHLTKSEFLNKFKVVDDIVDDVDTMLEEYLKEGIRFDKITAVVRFLTTVRKKAKLSKKKKRVVKTVIDELSKILVTYSVRPDGYRQHKSSHVRSGHWRHYKSGKKVWISKCVIHEDEYYKKEKR